MAMLDYFVTYYDLSHWEWSIEVGYWQQILS